MKRIFICGVALSLVLWACGDDSSSGLDAGGDESSSATELSSGAEDPTSSADAENPDSSTDEESSDSQPASSDTKNPDSSTDVESSSSVAGSPVQKVKVAGKCMESKGNSNIPGGDGLALPPHAIMGQEEGSDIAVVVVENVMMPDYQISGFAGMIVNPALLNSVEVTAVCDTLYVKQIIDEAKAAGGSKCLTEFHFALKADPAFTNTSFIVVDDYIRSPIEKQNYEPSSSSAVPSSSSVISGSVTVPASDVSLTCASNQNNDAGGRAGDGAIPPVARMYELGNKAEIVIETVQMNCAVQIENIDVSVGGDTLYVKPNIDESAPQANCICPTQLDFFVDADETFSDVTLLVFDYGGANNPSNKMSIIKETRVTPAN